MCSNGSAEQRAVLSPWPSPSDWTRRVNRPLNQRKLDKLRACSLRSRPFGDEAWTAQTAEALDLAHTLRGEGRPKKPAEDGN